MSNTTNQRMCIAHLVIENTEPCRNRAVAAEPLARRRYMLCDHHLNIIARDNKRAPREVTVVQRRIVETPESEHLKERLDVLEQDRRRLREQVTALLAERDNAWAKPRRSVPTEGTVYFLRIGGYVKIGWASELTSRMKAYPPDSVLLATMPGKRRDELAEHRRFAHLRTHGREWYPLAPQIMERIAAVVGAHGEPASVSFAAKPVTLKGTKTKQQMRVKSWR